MNLAKLLAKEFPPVTQRLEARDCILYALGIGIGARSEEPSELVFTYESGLKVFPSQVNVIAASHGWVRDPELQIDWVHLLHGEQSFEIHQPLEVGRTYVGQTRIVDVLDKGADKGAVLYVEKRLHDQETERLASTVTSAYVLRKDGGCGGTTSSARPPRVLPNRPHDAECALDTLPQAALIYRLSGDSNPIHVDPTLAKRAGFSRPILHGMCSLGVATRAIIQSCCDNRAEALRSLQLRFSAPVYPGETIVTEIWRDNDTISFRSRVPDRAVVLNNGLAVIKG